TFATRCVAAICTIRALSTGVLAYRLGATRARVADGGVEVFVKIRFRIVASVLLTGLIWGADLRAETLNLKLLPNQSRATFKSDAPLETFVGNTTAEGIDGTLAVDPARPESAAATVRVDMSLVRMGIERRDAQMRGKEFLDTENELNRWVTFEV